MFNRWIEKQIVRKIAIDTSNEKFNEIRLCYIKSGDVIDELTEVLKSDDAIKGGYYHYVYAVKEAVKEHGKLLLISTSKQTNTFCHHNNCATTIEQKIKGNVLVRFISWMYSLAVLFRKVAQFRPTHIICFKSSFLSVVYFYSVLFRIPYAVSIHNDMKRNHKLLQTPIIHFFIKKAPMVICHGPFLHEQVKNLVSKNVKILEYNASQIDLVNFVQESTTLPLDKQRKIFSFIGRLEEEKGVFDLYHAFKSIRAFHDSPLLVYAGPGSANQQLKQIIKKDNLDEDVVVLGPVSRKNVANLIARSYVVITPTRSTFSEGRCMTAMESLAMGVPLIAPKFGPFEYLIHDYQNGLFFTPDSKESLQQKLEEIMNPDLRRKLAEGATSISNQYIHTDFGYIDAVKAFLKTKR